IAKLDRARHIPQKQAVVVERDKQSAVRRKHPAASAASEAGELLDFGPTRNVPNPRDAVTGRVESEKSIGTEAHILHVAGSVRDAEGPNLLPRGQVPKPHHAVAPAGKCLATIGRYCHRPEDGGIATPTPKLRAGDQIKQGQLAFAPGDQGPP